MGTNTFRITLTSAAGQQLEGARVNLEGDMTHAGMSPVFSVAGETGPGQYQGKLKLNMRGDWIVLVHVTLKDGRTLDREWKFANIQAN